MQNDGGIAGGPGADPAADHAEEVTEDGQPLQAQPLQAQPLEAERLGSADHEGGAGPKDRPLPSTRRGFLALARNRRFLRLWGSQIVSNVGDWAYVLAVAVALTQRVEGGELASTMALLLAAEAAPSVLFGLLLAGSIVDRFPRIRLMVIADLARAAAVSSLLLVPQAAPLHFVLVAACLGLFRALFQPSLMASLANVVEGDEVVPANAVITGTFHLAIMVGPPIGALLVAAVGPSTAFALNAASFVVSAVLLAGIRLPRPEREEASSWTPVVDLVEGTRSIVRSTLARGIVVVMGLVLLLAATQSPIQIVFVHDVLTDGSAAAVARTLGLLTAAWGTGMVVGSFLAPAMSTRVPRERLLGLSIALVGGCFVVASRATGVGPVLVAWVVGGVATGIVNVAYETLLQERTPDGLRGRVFSTVEAAQDGMYLAGALVVGTIGLASSARAFFGVGIAFLGVGLLALGLMPDPPGSETQPAGGGERRIQIGFEAETA